MAQPGDRVSSDAWIAAGRPGPEGGPHPEVGDVIFLEYTDNSQFREADGTYKPIVEFRSNTTVGTLADPPTDWGYANFQLVPAGADLEVARMGVGVLYTGWMRMELFG
jgi:hypothetical protein